MYHTGKGKPYTAGKDKPLPNLSEDQVKALHYYCWPGSTSAGYKFTPQEMWDMFCTNLLAKGVLPPPKPEYAKPKRPVRAKDLEEGCILRYLGGPQYDGLRLTIGKEYVVRSPSKHGFSIDYDDDGGHTCITRGFWDAGGDLPWDFVSNPNYVHGLDKRKPVYLKDQAQYEGWFEGPIMVLRDYAEENPGAPRVFRDDKKRVFTDKGVWFVASDLTHEEPKPAVKTYKVRDGEAKAGDTVWWLACDGPKQVTLTNDRANGTHEDNVQMFPRVYQLAEPDYDYVNVAGYGKVKAYHYMQAPYNGSSEAYFKATEKQTPIPAKDWRAGDIVRCIDASGGINCFVVGNEYVVNSTCPTGLGLLVYAGPADRAMFSYRFEFVRRP